MTEIMVSVRLPRSLLEEIMDVVKKNHFLDMSEAVRSIVRQKWEENSDPLAYEAGRLRRLVEQELRRNIAEKSEQRLIEELNKIREKIKNEIQ